VANDDSLNDGSALCGYNSANWLISVTLGGATSLYARNSDGAWLKQTVAGTVITYTQDVAASLTVIVQA
jgi:hypothetical protein